MQGGVPPHCKGGCIGYNPPAATLARGNQCNISCPDQFYICQAHQYTRKKGIYLHWWAPPMWNQSGKPMLHWLQPPIKQQVVVNNTTPSAVPANFNDLKMGVNNWFEIHEQLSYVTVFKTTVLVWHDVLVSLLFQAISTFQNVLSFEESLVFSTKFFCFRNA
jgi:hypothetical protein